MPAGPGPLDEPTRFNVHTGLPVAEQAPIFAAARLGLEAPRYCGQCARRMIVQVHPTGWSARCSRHGEVDASTLEARAANRLGLGDEHEHPA